MGREKHGESAPKHGREAMRRYTEAEIIYAIHRWVAIYGAPPTSADWDRARALRQGNHTRLARLNDNSWPTTRMVRCSFGTFNSAIIRAGHIPRPVPSRLAGRFASPDEALLAIQAWAARYGEPPTMADWDPYRARRLGQEWRVTRYQDGDWPSTRSICRHFGNMNNAVRAAGLAPRARSQRSARNTKERKQLRRMLTQQRNADPTPGPSLLATRVRAVSSANSANDAMILRGSLIQLAAAALNWADQLHPREAELRVVGNSRAERVRRR